MAEIVHCTLEPSRSVASDELQSASHIFLQYFNRSAAIVQEQFQQEVEHDSIVKEEHSE